MAKNGKSNRLGKLELEMAGVKAELAIIKLLMAATAVAAWGNLIMAALN